jgi:chromosome segregation protein
VAALRRDLEVRAAGLEERRTVMSRRLAEVEERLRRFAGEREAATARRVELEGRLVATSRLHGAVTERLGTVETVLGELHEERRRNTARVRAAVERLDQLRRERSTAERQLVELRERAQRAELDGTEVRLRLEAAVESLRREFDVEPNAAVEVQCPELPEGANAANRVRELERELRIMGPINPLALEEFTALQERHEFLEGQLEDVKSSRRELAKVIRAIDSEIVDVFAAAFADVADNFTKLFSTLFPGGTGRLRLTDPDNLLETGIEVEARPSGKNVRKLSLLSGGERSLTALAFLFAVFRSRPSPFYLMDEVEAALDDVNLHRFIDLINEFRQEAQLLVVSHQKRTMEAADLLYGVTMQPGGSTKVVSERVAAGA